MLNILTKLGYSKPLQLITKNISSFSTWPSFQKERLQLPKTIVKVIHSSEASSFLKGKKVEQFQKEHKTIIDKEQVK